MGVGSNLKKILKEKHITIKQLAEGTGISVNTLYSITKRDSKRVNEGHIATIAKFLMVSPEELQKPLLGDYIYNAAAKRHLSPEDISDLTGISEDKLYNILNCDNVPISHDEKNALNQALGIDLDVFSMMGLEVYEEPSDTQKALLTAFDRLNDVGQQKAVERVQELGQIPAYQKTPPQD